MARVFSRSADGTEVVDWSVDTIDMLQIYDITTREWRYGASIPEQYYQSGSARRSVNDRGLAVDGKFIVMETKPGCWGYVGISVYDPLSDTWTVESGQPWRGEHTEICHACVHDGRLVVFTGFGMGERAYERAADGSWSSFECDRFRSGIRWVSESLILG